jgi:hypothetical protein
MSAAAVFNLAVRFAQLLYWGGGRDLRHRYDEAQLWFAGGSVYEELYTAIYPPATYAMLWPFLGYSSFALVKWIWAVLMGAALAWLSTLLVKESEARSGLERVCVALVPLSMYATGSAIGHGQVTIQVLALLVCGLTLICRGRGRWRDDLLGGGLLVATLVKPTISAPFMWMALLLPGKLRRVVIIGCGYAALTLLATEFQGIGLLSSHLAWARSAGSEAVKASDAGGGVLEGNYGNLNSWLGALGLFEWNLPASLLALLALGYWIHRHRHGDFWLILGVVALVARFWSYHRLYDDMLILLPMIALFRIASRGPAPDGHDVVSGVLLAVALAAVLVPSTPIGWLPARGTSLLELFRYLQTTLWVVMLLFLLHRARLEEQRRKSGLEGRSADLPQLAERSA